MSASWWTSSSAWRTGQADAGWIYVVEIAQAIPVV